jgi:hypothetical protein
MKLEVCLERISDDTLIARLVDLLGRSRRVEAELIAHLAEVDVRRLYLREACPSMHSYATERLHLSDAEAYLRITVARLSRRLPVVLDMLADGRLHLSGIARLAPHVRDGGGEELLARAAFLSKREIERLIAEIAPQPDVPALIRKLPVSRRAVGSNTQPVAASGLVPGGAVDDSVRANARPVAASALVPGEAADGSVGSNAQAIDAAVLVPDGAVDGSVGSSAQAGAASAFVPGGAVDGSVGSNAQAVDPSVLVAGMPGGAVDGSVGSNAQAVDPSVLVAGMPGGAAGGSVGSNAQAVDPSVLVAGIPGGAAGGSVANAQAVDASVLVPGGAERGGSAPVPAPRMQAMRPIAPLRYKVQFTAGVDLHDKIVRAQALLRRQIPDGDLAAVMDRAVTVLLRELERARFAATSAPRVDATAVDPTPRSRHIPDAIRRAVWERDGGQCTFRDRHGRRCPARERIEFHHVTPFALGGDHSLSNIRLTCAGHNALQAELDYGAEFMTARRRASRRPHRRERGAEAAP